MPEESATANHLSRRMLLRLGAAGGAGAALVAAQGWAGPLLAQKGLLSPDGAFAATSTALGDQLFYIEDKLPLLFLGDESFPEESMLLEVNPNLSQDKL